MNNHDQVRQLLPLAGAEALDETELQRVREHIAVCLECRQELESWGAITRLLVSIPQPTAPAGLVERTQSRIACQAAFEESRENGLLLGALAVFGWVAGIAFWVVVRAATDGSFPVLGVNLLNPGAWSVASMLIVWLTAGTAALMLGRLPAGRAS